jgi:type IV secretion system T-DNA border endonuclease VirD2
MVLNTDQPHPHVHLVVKAMSEHGQRLNIRKATLREWRHEFARRLREKGIEANATERAVRGTTQTHKPDRIYRAERGGRSTHLRDRVEAIAGELHKGHLRVEAGKTKMLETRIQVGQGWRAVSDRLVSEGKSALAAEVTRFAERMPRPRTEKEQIAQGLIEHVHRRRARDREQQLTR